MKILIDNGHGLNTPGKRSPDGKFLEAIYNQLVRFRLTYKFGGGKKIDQEQKPVANDFGRFRD